MHVSFDEYKPSKEDKVIVCDDDDLVGIPIESNINADHVEQPGHQESFTCV